MNTNDIILASIAAQKPSATKPKELTPSEEARLIKTRILRKLRKSGAIK